MARRTVEVVLKEFDAAWDDKRDWEGIHREVYEFGLPQRNPYHSGDPTGVAPRGGARKMDRVFDSTLPNAALRLANRLQSELCPPGRKWADMKPGQFIARENREQAKEELAGIEEALFAALHLSSFDQAINEWFLELVGPGTAVMAVMEGTGDSPIDFICVPQSQVALREGPNGKVWGMYRKHQMLAALIEDMWPDAKLPQKIRDMIEKDPAVTVQLSEALYYSNADKRWFYDVLWREGQSNANVKPDADRLVEREYVDGYWVVTRWIKAVGETHGRGPAMFALADAKTLNKLKELLLMNASLAVKGVWLVRHDAVINPMNVAIRPGATIPVRTTGGPSGAAIVPLQVGGDLHLSQLLVEELRNAINEAMLNKALPPVTASVRSPTEIVERLKEIQQDLGAPLGRVITEGLIPMMQLALGVLGRQGIIPLPNKRAIPINGAQVKFEISSPLVKAQNLANVEAVTQWATLLKQLFGDEVLLLTAKVEDVGAYLAEQMDIAPTLVRSEPERQNIQKLVGVALAQAGVGAPPVAANSNGGGIAASGPGSVPIAA